MDRTLAAVVDRTNMKRKWHDDSGAISSLFTIEQEQNLPTKPPNSSSLPFTLSLNTLYLGDGSGGLTRGVVVSWVRLRRNHSKLAAHAPV